MVLTTDEDHTTIWEKDSIQDFNITFFNERVVIRLDEEFREFIGTPKNVKRYSKESTIFFFHLVTTVIT